MRIAVLLLSFAMSIGFDATVAGAETTVIITADDVVRGLWIDGEAVAPGPNAQVWQKPDVHRVAHDVRCVAIEAGNDQPGWWWGGVIARLDHDDGRCAGTDASWKVAAGAPPPDRAGRRWHHPDYDDSDWADATASGIYGLQTIAPWISLHLLPLVGQRWIWCGPLRTAVSPVYMRRRFPGNQTPTVRSPARALPNPAAGRETALAVLGDDDGGQGRLTYTWSVIGTAPGPVSFERNGGFAAQATSARFTAAGDYTFAVAIADRSGATTTTTVAVSVLATAADLRIAPSELQISIGATDAFTAVARDQFDAVIANPPLVWSVDGGGSIDQVGLFRATTAGGPFLVTATLGELRAQALVRVHDANGSPTFVDPPRADDEPVLVRDTVVRVLADDDGGEGALTYHWRLASSPDGASVVFDRNGDNDAKLTRVTFTKAGSYVLTALVRDAAGNEAVAPLSMTVAPVPTAGVVVAPLSAAIFPGRDRPFLAIAADQFGEPITGFAWSVDGGGTIDPATGVFIGSPGGGGPWTVTARRGDLVGTAVVQVLDGGSASLEDAIVAGGHDERLSLLLTPQPFDPVAYAAAPDLYLNAIEPGRVWQPAAAGSDIPPLRAPDGRRFRGGPSWPVTLRVATIPRAPVTFSSLESGAFALNGLPVITVQADDAGDASVVFTPTGRRGETRIVAASPMASGRVVFRVMGPTP